MYDEDIFFSLYNFEIISWISNLHIIKEKQRFHAARNLIFSEKDISMNQVSRIFITSSPEAQYLFNRKFSLVLLQHLSREPWALIRFSQAYNTFLRLKFLSLKLRSCQYQFPLMHSKCTFQFPIESLQRNYLLLPLFQGLHGVTFENCTFLILCSCKAKMCSEF